MLECGMKQKKRDPTRLPWLPLYTFEEMYEMTRGLGIICVEAAEVVRLGCEVWVQPVLFDMTALGSD